MIEATPEEAKFIRAFERLAKKMPDSLWLYSASGSLHVMQKGPSGGHAHVEGKRVEEEGEGLDSDYSLATIAIENDGGDW